MLCVYTFNANAQWSSGRPDGHAPIQVMGDHTHGQGEVMISYRYMLMNMDGNGDGTNELSNSEILMNGSGSYMVTPESMPMEMHMLGAMYAVSDKTTFMAMIPYLNNSMDHATAMGGAFTTGSSGLGDIKLTALYKFVEQGNSRAHWHLGVSIPTGSIEAKDQTPMSGGNDVILPYPMQLGSGSFDFLPGFTYLAQNSNLSFGTQLKGVVRLTDNDNEYRLGDRFEATSWLGYKVNDMISPQLALRFSTWSDISGNDSRLNPNMVHTADPDLKAGSRVDLGIGLNIQGPEGPVRDVRLAANYDLPIYQYLDGPQMLTKGILTIGLQYTF